MFILLVWFSLLYDYPVEAFLSHFRLVEDGSFYRMNNKFRVHMSSERIKDTFSGLEEGGDDVNHYEDDNNDDDGDDNWLAKWKPDVGEISKPILEYQEIIVKGTEGNDASCFKEYAQRGLKAFRETNDVHKALQFFEKAKEMNSGKRPQPFSQRGILLYIAKNFEDAQVQLAQDIGLIEEAKIFKATDLRLWRSACLHKLGRKEEAITCLDVENEDPSGLIEDKYLMIQLLNFYAGKKTLEEMIECIGTTENTDGNDLVRTSFFGNFYLGLYFDATDNEYFGQAFLSICAASEKYPKNDMWYHLPRVFVKERGYTQHN